MSQDDWFAREAQNDCREELRQFGERCYAPDFFDPSGGLRYAFEDALRRMPEFELNGTAPGRDCDVFVLTWKGARTTVRAIMRRLFSEIGGKAHDNQFISVERRREGILINVLFGSPTKPRLGYCATIVIAGAFDG